VNPHDALHHADSTYVSVYDVEHRAHRCPCCSLLHYLLTAFM
jgi:hypothetical protein